MEFLKRIFKIFIYGFISFVLLLLAIFFLFSPSKEEQIKIQEKEAIQKNKDENASKLREQAILETELKNNRVSVIEEINNLMKEQKYLPAYQKADHFRNTNDEELASLGKVAWDHYQESEKVKQQQKEREFASALQKMKKTTDKVEGLDWYKDKSSPSHNNQNGFFLYIGKSGAGSPWLRLKIQYTSEVWLFIDSFIVVADGQKFERNHAKFERDNSTTIWEWYDENLTGSDLEMVKAVIASKEAIIRFNGRQYHADKIITASQKTALKNVLNAYEALGGR